jgi:hypothetical protein
MTATGLAVEPEDQCQAFVGAFFPRRAPIMEANQPDDPEPLPPRDFPPITAYEIQQALSGSSNTSAPGVSGTTYRLLKWAFEIDQDVFTRLFNASVTLGCYPVCLKTALVAVIPKPNKADMSSPRSYRPISLLECLGKLLEKVIAKRVTYEVGKHDLVPTRQFGGRDKSSVIDAAMSLTHDIHSAWRKGLLVSVLAFDVKGYFDNINHARLVRTMELLGFAPSLTAWVKSFMEDRHVMVRVDGHKGARVEITSVGMPQGSPLSMILSSIYTALIYLRSKHRGYMDDGLSVAAARTVEETVKTLAEDFKPIYAGLRAIGLDTDNTKFEVAHFTRAKRHTNSILHTPVIINIITPDGNTQPMTVFPVPVLRWLGIYLDTKLTFKPHVKIMANRARSTIAGLRLLANTVRGLKQTSARLLYKTVVLPVLTFGAAVYYTGYWQATLIKPLITA